MAKIKLFSILLLLFCSFSVVFAQSDTIYYDIWWGETGKAEAVYFRPLPVAEKEGFRIKDYYRSGAVQMSAFSLSAAEELLEGEVVWYYESGEVQQKAFYKGGLMEGPFLVYDQEGKLLSEGRYQNNRPFEGEFLNLKACCQILERYRNGQLISQTFSDLPQGSKARMEVQYSGGSNYPAEMSFYHQSGKYMGKVMLDQEGKERTGISVDYAYNPMIVLSVKEFAEGKMVGPVKHYYSNGQLKKEAFYVAGRIVKEVVYTQEGNILDSLTYQYDAPYTGTQYHFVHDEKASGNDVLSFSETYKRGKLQGPYVEFYRTGMQKERGQYVNGQKEGEVHFFDETGAVSFTGTYKEGYQKEGTFRISDTEQQVYQNGVLKETRVYYANGQPQRISKSQTIDLFYDSAGKELGRLTYKEGKPYEGKYLYFWGSRIARLQEYRKGNIISDQTYNEKGVIEIEYFYDEAGRKTRTIEFYTNGKKKIETELTDSAVEKITYFDQQGNILGAVHYGLDTNGEEYYFQFDRILKVIRYKDNEIIGEKVYMEDGRLLYETDYYGDGVFYNKNGKLLSKASYREGKPFDGIVYKYEEYDKEVLEQIPYKNGLLEGEYVKYEENYSGTPYNISVIIPYKANKKEGVYKEFYKGQLLYTVTYKEDLRVGKATYYDKSGKLLGEAQYRNNEPYHGTFYSYEYDFSIKQTEMFKKGARDGESRYYERGQLIKVQRYAQNELLEESYYKEGKAAFSIAYKNGQPYEGVQVNYDNHVYYKAGRKTRQLYYSDYTFTMVDLEIVYYEKTDKVWVTGYYKDSQKRYLIEYSGDLKNGEAAFYQPDGQLIGKGRYELGQPVQGTFVYDSYNQPDACLIIEIKEQIMEASVFEMGEKVFSIQSEVRPSDAAGSKREQILSFYDLIKYKYRNEYNLEEF